MKNPVCKLIMILAIASVPLGLIVIFYDSHDYGDNAPYAKTCNDIYYNCSRYYSSHDSRILKTYQVLNNNESFLVEVMFNRKTHRYTTRTIK